MLSPLRSQSGAWEEEIEDRYAEAYLDLDTVAVFREIWAHQVSWFSLGGGDRDPIIARDPAMQELWKKGFGSEAKKAVRALREQASEKLRTVARHGKED